MEGDPGGWRGPEDGGEFGLEGGGAPWGRGGPWRAEGLSHKKGCTPVSSREVDGSRACQTEWSLKEENKSYIYINAHIWNLEKWYWWTYLTGQNRDTDGEKRCWTQPGKERMGWVESVALKHILYHMWNRLWRRCYTTQRAQLGALWQRGGVRRCGWWVWGSRGRGHVYTYGSFTLLYGISQHNIVKQLSSN